MDLHGPGNRAYRSGSDAVLAGSFEGGFAQLGMRSQTEVIIRSKIDDLLAVESADGGLLVFKYTEIEVGALGLEVVQLICEI